MDLLPFNQRFGIEVSKVIDNDFPKTARIGLFNLLSIFAENRCVFWSAIRNELLRTARIEYNDIDEYLYINDCKDMLYNMEWYKIFIFCERVYQTLLHEVGHSEYGYNNAEEYIVDKTLSEVKEYFSRELRNLLLEENISVSFENGEFNRIGKVQTQKNINKVNSVLIDPRLQRVKQHYQKAQKCFNENLFPDNENCIKEAICALESCADILTGEDISKDFSSRLKKYGGSSEDKIPTPIIESIVKVYGYRGTGKGVAHGNIKGLRVTKIEAELVLSLTAVYITYLVDFFSSESEIPF